MKFVFLLTATLSSFVALAQPKIVTQAIITTSTNIIAPDDDEDVTQIQGGRGDGGGMNFRNMMDGETKSTTYIKNDMVKTDYKSDVFKGTMYRDNVKKTTSTVIEMMGNKQGFISTDDEQEAMKKRMDSIREARAKSDTTGKPRMRNVEPTITVAYSDDTKKIAGYDCKKAIIITDKVLKKDSMIVWYTPEIKFATVPSTGGMSGFGGMSNQIGGTNGFEKVNGFVMQYDRPMPRGRKMEVKVTKIVTDKEIATSEFDIPKDIEFKSMKDMGQGGGMRMMMGGRPQ